PLTLRLLPYAPGGRTRLGESAGVPCPTNRERRLRLGLPSQAAAVEHLLRRRFSFERRAKNALEEYGGHTAGQVGSARGQSRCDVFRGLGAAAMTRRVKTSVMLGRQSSLGQGAA